MLRGVLEHPEPYRGHAPESTVEQWVWENRALFEQWAVRTMEYRALSAPLILYGIIL